MAFMGMLKSVGDFVTPILTSSHFLEVSFPALYPSTLVLVNKLLTIFSIAYL
jgi:hypothetical protein